MHYICSEAIAQLICAFIFTCAHDAAHILNLIKAVDRLEIVNIICTPITSFNFSKSANCNCHSEETAYTVATKNVSQIKRQVLNTLASLTKQTGVLLTLSEDRFSHYEADF